MVDNYPLIDPEAVKDDQIEAAVHTGQSTYYEQLVKHGRNPDDLNADFTVEAITARIGEVGEFVTDKAYDGVNPKAGGFYSGIDKKAAADPAFVAAQERGIGIAKAAYERNKPQAE